MAFSGQEQEEMFQELLEQALQEKEIIDGINKTNLSKKDIPSEIIDPVKKKEREIWSLATKEIQEFNDIKKKCLSTLEALEKLDTRFKGKKDKPYDESDFLPKSSIVRLFLMGLLLLCFYLLVIVFGIVFVSYYNLTGIAIVWVIAWVAITIIIYRSRKREHQKTAKAKYKEFKIHREEYEQEHKALSDANEHIKQAVYEKGILPELRSRINSRLNKSYETFFPPVRPSGLAEIDPDYEILTKSHEELQQHIKSMPGGSIGVAGPRGAGKTTLLHSLEQLKELQGRLPLSVFISAPVEYNARDFILQIFSMVCSKFLESEKRTSSDLWGVQGRMQQPSLESNPGIHFLSMRSIRTTALAFGLILMGGSVALLHKSIITTDSIALGMSPNTLFPWGLFLVICGVAGFFAHRYSQKVLAKTNEEKSNHVGQAREWLKKIKFQQSYSSGWSGTLQLPLALAGSTTSTFSLAENQLSLPEIIEEYRHFLKEISAKNYIVIIAIDEMDKLESDEKAEHFLNEIKAIFGIPNCFYLISVSESAMSSFERRGLPFRDVFDSSFDRIISVDYLDYQDTDRLLSRRVIGLPVPFVSLCYCLSGGLPRDLIRKCRDLLAQNPENKTLADLCNSLIWTDIQAILRSFIIKARKDLSGTERYQFLAMADQVKKTPFPSKETIHLLHEMEQNIQKQEQTETLQVELLTYLYYVITLIEYFTAKTDAAMWENVKCKELDQLANIQQCFSTSFHDTWTMISSFRKEAGMGSLD